MNMYDRYQELAETMSSELAMLTAEREYYLCCAGCGNEAAGNVEWIPGWVCVNCKEQWDIIIQTPAVLTCTMILVKVGAKPWEVSYRKLLHII